MTQLAQATPLQPDTELDPSLRELVILRVTQRCKGRYAWVQHAAMARTVGVSDAQIVALERDETPADLFADRERTAFLVADELVDTAGVSAHTFALVQQTFLPREAVELLLLVGCFRMICGLMTALDVEVESPFGAEVLELARKTA